MYNVTKKCSTQRKTITVNFIQISVNILHRAIDSDLLPVETCALLELKIFKFRLGFSMFTLFNKDNI
jgi:hypothetical protein